MNKSPIPKWPLYVADAAMLAAVFAIAYPNIVLMETMSAAGILLCSLLCAGAMAMVLAPFIFEYLNQKQRIGSDARKARADIDLIFENLSALQLMIAETRELGDSIEEKLAFQLAKDTDIKFESFNNALEDLRNLTKVDVKAAADKAAEMLESLAQTDARIAELSAEVARLADSRDAQTLEAERAEKKYEEVLDELDALKNGVAEMKADIEQSRKQMTEMRELEADASNAVDGDDFDIVSDEEPDNIDSADSDGESSEEANADFSNSEADDEEPSEEPETFETADVVEASEDEAEEEGDFEKEEDVAEEDAFDAERDEANEDISEDFGEESSEADEDSAEAEDVEESDAAAPEREAKNKLEGIMQKALNNAASNAWSVEKIISGSGVARSEENAQSEDVDAHAHADAKTPVEESDDADNFAEDAEGNAAETDDIGESEAGFEAEGAAQNASEADVADGVQDGSTTDPMQDSDFDEEKIDDTLLDGLDFDEQSDPDAEDADFADSVEEVANAEVAEDADDAGQKIVDENLSEVALKAQANSDSEPNAAQAATEPAAAPVEDGLLFDNAELPQTKKPVYKKGASITLRSMIGIGNKPYLRGNVDPLSPDKGVEMDYAEIGVWKLPLPDFEGELTFSVWKNDEEQIGEAAYTAESGRKTEITI